MVRVIRTTNQAITNGVVTSIVFDSQQYDTDSMWINSQPGIVTIQTPGVYAIGGCIYWAAATTTGVRRICDLKITKAVGGAVIFPVRDEQRFNTTATEMVQECSTEYWFDEGDTLELTCFQGGTGGLNVLASPEFAQVLWASYRGPDP